MRVCGRVVWNENIDVTFLTPPVAADADADVSTMTALLSFTTFLLWAVVAAAPTAPAPPPALSAVADTNDTDS